jgi:hypothetical protein
LTEEDLEEYDEEIWEGIERPGEDHKGDQDDDDNDPNGGEMMPIPEMF